MNGHDRPATRRAPNGAGRSRGPRRRTGHRENAVAGRVDRPRRHARPARIECDGVKLGRDVPFWVIADALEEYVRGLAPTVLEPLGVDVVADLSQVLPLINGTGDGASAPVTHERYRSHRAVRLLLERLAANRPLVLVLDDMHWADSGSFELLLALLHRPPVAPVLIAVAFRPHLLPDRVERARARRASRDADPHPARGAAV